MPSLKEGDRVRVVTRTVTEEDRKANRYFDHMAGRVGTVQNIFGNNEVSIRVDPENMSPVTAEVLKVSVQRMRQKFAESVSEEQRKMLSKEELEFNANFVLVVHAEDLEKA